MVHSRLDQALRAAEISEQIAQHLDLNEDDRHLLACANLIRDLKRPALGDQGGSVLSYLRCSSFNHTTEVVSALRNAEDEIALTLRRNGVDPLAVADVLDPEAPRFRRLHFIAHDLSDRLALVAEGFMGSVAPDLYKHLAQHSTEQILAHLRSKDGSACFTTAEPVMTMLALSRMLDQEITYSPAALIAGDVLTEGAKAAVARGSLTENDFTSLTDDEVISVLPDIFKGMMSGIIEDELHIIAVHPRKPYTIPTNGLAPLARALKSALRVSLDSDQLFCASVPDYGRSLTMTLLSEDGTLKRCPYRAEVPFSARAIAVGISRAASEAKLFEALSAVRRSFKSLGLDVSIEPQSRFLQDSGLFDKAEMVDAQ
jgi:hypothetical protein